MDLYRYVVITDHQTAPGFALGGVEVKGVENGAGASEALVDCFEDKRVGLVAINDRFIKELTPAMMRKVENSSSPVVVPFPDPARRGPEGIEDFLSAVISRAIGYRVRLKT